MSSTQEYITLLQEIKERFEKIADRLMLLFASHAAAERLVDEFKKTLKQWPTVALEGNEARVWKQLDQIVAGADLHGGLADLLRHLLKSSSSSEIPETTAKKIREELNLAASLLVHLAQVSQNLLTIAQEKHQPL